jgi:hypothetical protein
LKLSHEKCAQVISIREKKQNLAEVDVNNSSNDKSSGDNQVRQRHAKSVKFTPQPSVIQDERLLVHAIVAQFTAKLTSYGAELDIHMQINVA